MKMQEKSGEFAVQAFLDFPHGKKCFYAKFGNPSRIFLILFFFFSKYGGHAATLSVYFIFWVSEPRIELGAALQQHDALPVGYVAYLILLTTIFLN